MFIREESKTVLNLNVNITKSAVRMVVSMITCTVDMITVRCRM